MSARADEVEQYICNLTIAELEQLPAGIDADAIIIVELRRRDAEAAKTVPLGTTPVERAAEVAYGALLEVGRPDLAGLVAFHFEEDGTPYLEPLDEVVGADLDLMQRAEGLALTAIGGQP